MGKVIGIDLGTTNSCVAVMEGGKPVVIPNAEGGRTTPSVVAFGKNGDRLVGDSARRQMTVNPQKTVSSIKRYMGSDHRIMLEGRRYTPQELSAFILMKLKKDAESFLGEEVTEAVITVPAYFNDAQRQATKDAGRIAGLKVQRIINEPTAAALAYGLDHGNPQKILVYDLGGGTFDVSIIEIGDSLIEVLSTAGDNHLGGDDFDQRIVDWMVREFKRLYHYDLYKDASALQRVREEAENAKKTLSSASTVSINIPFIASVKGTPLHLEMELSRNTFHELIRDLVDRTAAPVQQALQDAGLQAADLGMVLLVGGSTRIPAVQDKVRALLHKEPSRGLNPDECVALGACIQGGKLGGNLPSSSAANDIILMDVTPLSLSIETVGGVATRLIDRNTTIPTRKSQIFTTAANFQTSVDIKVLQGERHFARDNKLIGNFRLTGIKRARAGVPQIEVTFDIDVNGIVKVSATDLGTGKAQEITITSSSNMSEEEIEDAIRNARQFASEDQAVKDAVQLYTEAETLYTRAEGALKEHKKELDTPTRNQIKKELSTVKHLLHAAKPERMTPQLVRELKEAKEALERSASGIL